MIFFGCFWRCFSKLSSIFLLYFSCILERKWSGVSQYKTSIHFSWNLRIEKIFKINLRYFLTVKINSNFKVLHFDFCLHLKKFSASNLKILINYKLIFIDNLSSEWQEIIKSNLRLYDCLDFQLRKIYQIYWSIKTKCHKHDQFKAHKNALKITGKSDQFTYSEKIYFVVLWMKMKLIRKCH